MHIDTDAANREFEKKEAVAWEEELSPSEEDHFMGQRAPPTYKEATTPSIACEEARSLLPGRPDHLPKKDNGRRQSLWKRRVFRLTTLAMVLLTSTAVYVSHRQQSVPTVSSTAHSGAAEVEAQAQVPVQVESDLDTVKDLPSFPIKWPTYCNSDYNTKSHSFEFESLDEFSAVENLRQQGQPQKHIFGWVHVVPAPSSQKSGVVAAKVSFAASPSIDINNIPLKKTSTGFIIGNDQQNMQEWPRGCLAISVVIALPAKTEFSQFSLSSAHLGAEIHADTGLHVKEDSRIRLHSGTFSAAPFDSQRTWVNTSSGSITGTYLLNENLHISSLSGSINVEVLPQPSKRGKEGVPANLEVDSKSGSIRVDVKRDDIPDRDYRTKIDALAGSIRAELIHGTSTSITSFAGSVEADLIPFGTDKESTLVTSSKSGRAAIDIHKPYVSRRSTARSSALDKLTSTHKAQSGSLELSYPSVWSGHIEAKTISGSLSLTGEGLKLIEREERPGLRKAKAVRGDGQSSMKVEGISGSVRINADLD